MSDDDLPLDPKAYITSHGYIHHRPTDARQIILDLTRERDEARAEVERLREENRILRTTLRHDFTAALRRLDADLDRLPDAERFRWLAGQKRLHLHTDGGTWTRDDGTTFRAWGVLAANGVGYPAAETLAQLVDTARADQEDGCKA